MKKTEQWAYLHAKTHVISRRGLTFALLMISAFVSLHIKCSVASASPLTTLQANEWLKVSDGVTRYHLTSSHGGHAVIWESVERESQSEIHLWHAMERVTHRGRPRDRYIVERRRFKATPPFNLIGFDAYHLEEGEARALSWRTSSQGETGSGSHGRQGTWLMQTPAPELRQDQRPDWRRGVSIAERMWHDQTLKLKPQPLEVHETLKDHLNLMFSHESRRSGYQLAVRDKTLVEGRFTISRYDERITRHKGRWATTRELKIVDDSGDASSVILNAKHQMLALHIGDHIQVIRDGYHPNEVKSRTLLLLAEGRLTQAVASELRSRARSVTRSCRTLSASKQTVKARLHIAPHGSVDDVSFDLRPQWGDLERCLAKSLGSLRPSENPERRALASVSISL